MFGIEKDRDKAVVFVVDDMEINRIVLEEIIRHMGCEPVLFEGKVQWEDKILVMVGNDLNVSDTDGDFR